MKDNSLPVGMAVLLALLALGVAVFVLQYVQLTRSLNQAQSAITQIELRQNRLKALIHEAVEYSQRNPAINPILQAVGAKQAPTSTNKPASR